MRHVDPSVYTDQIFNRIKFMESLLFLPIEQLTKKPLSNFEWVECRVKCGRQPGEANT